MIDARSGITIPDGLPVIPVDRCVIAPWNPNKQSDKTFNSLVENIREEGFVETVRAALMTPELRRKYLTPEQDAIEGAWYLIIGGAHRLDAARLLDMEGLPAVVSENYDEDRIKFQNVRMNALKGKIDPAKFTGLYMEMVERYGEELVAESMGLTDKRELESMILKVRNELPPDMQKKMDEAKDEIQTVDDLSRVLNELFSKYGDTIPLSFLVFTFGNKTHLWVGMDRPLMKKVDQLKAYCGNARYDMAEVLNVLLDDQTTKLAGASFTPVDTLNVTTALAATQEPTT